MVSPDGYPVVERGGRPRQADDRRCRPLRRTQCVCRFVILLSLKLVSDVVRASDGLILGGGRDLPTDPRYCRIMAVYMGGVPSMVYAEQALDAFDQCAEKTGRI